VFFTGLALPGDFAHGENSHKDRGMGCNLQGNEGISEWAIKQISEWAKIQINE